MAFQLDITKFKDLLYGYYQLTKIRIGLCDSEFNPIASYPEDICTFCLALREIPQMDEACMMSDADALKECRAGNDVYVYRCHAGLTEVFAPIIYDHVLYGYVFLGHILQYSSVEEGWEQVCAQCGQNCDSIGLLRDVFFSSYETATSDNTLQAAIELLKACIYYFQVNLANTAGMSGLLVQYEIFVSTHMEEKVTCEDICEYLKISKSRLYKLVEEHFGQTVTEHIWAMRMKKCQTLLERTDLLISEISSSVGISDYNYFSRCFKRFSGVSPRKYRQIHQTIMTKR